MGIVIGLCFGIGMLTVLEAATAERAPASTPAFLRRIAAARGQIGIALLAALGGAILGYAISSNLVLAAAGAILGAFAPRMLRLSRRRKAQAEARQQWPDCLDDVVAGLRAGMSVGESLASLSERGPDGLKPHFADFAAELQATGRLDSALDRLKTTMAEPVTDRVVEAIRMASRLGGHDLTRMLTALAVALRAENAARGELLARQSWTVGGARVAAAAPWIVLAMLATRPGFAGAFATPLGTMILLAGLGATAFAYWMMLRIGRLPEAPRVLAGGGQ